MRKKRISFSGAGAVVALLAIGVAIVVVLIIVDVTRKPPAAPPDTCSLVHHIILPDNCVCSNPRAFASLLKPDLTLSFGHRPQHITRWDAPSTFATNSGAMPLGTAATTASNRNNPNRAFAQLLQSRRQK